jgi:hypothetical protein
MSGMIKYDDASWHCHGGAFPTDLPDAAAATHIAMFVMWALLSSLGGSRHVGESPQDLEQLKSRGITPVNYFLRACDGRFTDGDLSFQGNLFAASYFGYRYLQDYDNTFCQNLPSLYHVEDSWENFDRLKPLLNRRFADWTRGSNWGRVGRAGK